jgi:hypothetical protein
VLYCIIHDAVTKLHNNHNNDSIVFLQIGVSFSFYNNIYKTLNRINGNNRSGYRLKVNLT